MSTRQSPAGRFSRRVGPSHQRKPDDPPLPSARLPPWWETSPDRPQAPGRQKRTPSPAARKPLKSMALRQTLPSVGISRSCFQGNFRSSACAVNRAAGRRSRARTPGRRRGAEWPPICAVRSGIPNGRGNRQRERRSGSPVLWDPGRPGASTCERASGHYGFSDG